jgi:hypothetical protein
LGEAFFVFVFARSNPQEMIETDILIGIVDFFIIHWYRRAHDTNVKSCLYRISHRHRYDRLKKQFVAVVAMNDAKRQSRFISVDQIMT